MSSSEQIIEESKSDSQFSVDLKTNKIKNKKRKKKSKKIHKIISSNYKKEKCIHYNKGSCHAGDQCTFRHDFEPECKKTICKHFLMNSCIKGNECNFSHIYPCKFYHLQNKCNQGQLCRFSHQPLNNYLHSFSLEDFLNDNKDTIMSLYKQNRIELINDKMLKKQVYNFVRKQLASIEKQEQQNAANIIANSLLGHPKKHAYKGQLKLLAQNNVIKPQQPVIVKDKQKPLDPRLKLKQSIPQNNSNKSFAHQNHNSLSSFDKNKDKGFARSWLKQIPFRAQQPIDQGRKIPFQQFERFLYSYY